MTGVDLSDNEQLATAPKSKTHLVSSTRPVGQSGPDLAARRHRLLNSHARRARTGSCHFNPKTSRPNQVLEKSLAWNYPQIQESFNATAHWTLIRKMIWHAG
jgi:hypothetical protein